MKKTILTIAALLVTGMVANAQTEAGKIWVGGSIGFGNNGGSTTTISGTGTPLDGETKTSGSTTIDFAPNVQYFLNDNMSVGLGINFGTKSTNSKMFYDPLTGATNNNGAPGYVEYDNKISNTGIGLNLFVNQFNDLNDNLKWYYGANLGFSNGSSKSTSIEETSPGNYAPTSVPGGKLTSISLGANLGAVYFLNDQWAFFGGMNNLFALNYNMGKTETKLSPGTLVKKSGDFNLSLGTGGVNIGAITFGAYYMF